MRVVFTNLWSAIVKTGNTEELTGSLSRRKHSNFLTNMFVTDVTDKGDTGRPTMTGRVSKQERQTSARSATTKRVDGN